MVLKGVQNQNEARNVESKDFSLGSDGKGDSVRRESQGRLCYNVVGNLSAFYIHAWRLCLKLNLEEIQDHETCRLWCRHWWLFLVRFAVGMIKAEEKGV